MIFKHEFSLRGSSDCHGFDSLMSLLVPLGFAVSVGKQYEVPFDASSAMNGANTNGHTNGQGQSHAETVHGTGKYFTYLTAPTGLLVLVSELAAIALEIYDLKFAYGEIFQVESDNSVQIGQELATATT
jgi:hypothetical protein